MSLPRVIGTLAVAAMCWPWVSCSPAKIAGGTDTETGGIKVTGSIRNSDGIPAPNTVVVVIPADYDPARDAPPARSLTDTTDADGSYAVRVAIKGRYNIQAMEPASRTRLLLQGIDCCDSAVHAPAGTLAVPGSVRIFLPDSVDEINGYCYIPGTDRFSRLQAKIDFVVIDSVPVGIIPEIRYATFISSDSTVIRRDIAVNSGDTANVYNPGWEYGKRITLNTGASGAGTSGDVVDFPVLIRLNANNFKFPQSPTSGADIRFTKADGTPLPFQIERWDPVAGLAEVWVKIDTVFGNTGKQFITMYCGAPAADSRISSQGSAASFSNGAAVFDTACGFQGVWHLGDAARDSIRDATVNGFYGISPDSSCPAIAEGVIGTCRNFDGISRYITMPNTASGRLNFAEDGSFTVSAWIYVDTFDSATVDYSYRTVASKGYKQYYLQLTSFPSNKPLWEFSNFSEADKWRKSTSPAAEKQWVLLTGVVHGSSQYLYCNGEFVDSTTNNYAQAASRDVSEDFSIGRFFKEATFPVNGLCYFKGKIDEVSVSGVARSGDWIRLCYMNQRSDDRLVQLK